MPGVRVGQKHKALKKNLTKRTKKTEKKFPPVSDQLAQCALKHLQSGRATLDCSSATTEAFPKQLLKYKVTSTRISNIKKSDGSYRQPTADDQVQPSVEKSADTSITSESLNALRQDIQTGFERFSIIFSAHEDNFSKPEWNCTDRAKMFVYDPNPYIVALSSSHHKTYLCNTTARRSLQNGTAVSINRTMILSEKQDQSDMVILYEEARIQEFKIDGTAEDHGHLYTAKATETAAQLHFLGNQAFTVNLGDVSNLNTNGGYACAQLSGWLAGKLQKIFSAGTTVSKFFDPVMKDWAAYYTDDFKHEHGKDPQSLDLLQRSFLASQHAQHLTSAGKYRVRLWHTSLGFSMLALSPKVDRGRVYIFLWIRELGSSLERTSTPPVIKGHNSEPRRHSRPLAVHSTLPPELELELELM